MMLIMSILMASLGFQKSHAASQRSQFLGSWSGPATLTFVSRSTGEPDQVFKCSKLVVKVAESPTAKDSVRVNSACLDPDRTENNVFRYFYLDTDLPFCASDNSYCWSTRGGESGRYGHLSILRDAHGLSFWRSSYDEDGDGSTAEAAGLSHISR